MENRVVLSMDGNCGCALLGQDLQVGEAEFVCVDDAPKDCPRPEHWAITQAYRKLCARLNNGNPLPYYWDR